jgi:hypothetical protein
MYRDSDSRVFAPVVPLAISLATRGTRIGLLQTTCANLRGQFLDARAHIRESKQSQLPPIVLTKVRFTDRD